MKIKQLLGMLALDANANEIGKIIDADFDSETGAITQVVISLKKNFLSSNQMEVDFTDVKSIGDYVLLNIEVDKEMIFEEAEKAKQAEKEAKKKKKKKKRKAKRKKKKKKKAEEAEVEEEKEVVEAEVVGDDDATDVKID